MKMKLQFYALSLLSNAHKDVVVERRVQIKKDNQFLK
jgi:hypothetical protein